MGKKKEMTRLQEANTNLQEQNTKLLERPTPEALEAVQKENTKLLKRPTEEEFNALKELLEAEKLANGNNKGEAADALRKVEEQVQELTKKNKIQQTELNDLRDR